MKYSTKIHRTNHFRVYRTLYMTKNAKWKTKQKKIQETNRGNFVNDFQL